MNTEHSRDGVAEHPHEHDHHRDDHSHGLIDPSIVRSREGVKAVSLGLAVLLAASVVQLAVFLVSDSVALLTDVIHNGGDALTAIPLGIAFLARSRRGERWAGYCVVAVILASALLALVQVVERLLHPQTPSHLWALLGAGSSASSATRWPQSSGGERGRAWTYPLRSRTATMPAPTGM